MTPQALLMLTIAILTVWGGLVAAAVNLFKRPDLAQDVEDIPPST